MPSFPHEVDVEHAQGAHRALGVQVELDELVDELGRVRGGEGVVGEVMQGDRDAGPVQRKPAVHDADRDRPVAAVVVGAGVGRKLVRGWYSRPPGKLWKNNP